MADLKWAICEHDGTSRAVRPRPRQLISCSQAAGEYELSQRENPFRSWPSPVNDTKKFPQIYRNILKVWESGFT